MSDNRIRLMIVDDSISFRHFLCQSLAENPEFEVVGTAIDAVNAKKKIGALRPDVIILDMELPVIRGADFLRDILPQFSHIKVVVISYISNNVFEALQAGAVDFVSKPDTRPGFDHDQFLKELTAKIKVAVSSSPTPVLNREDEPEMMPKGKELKWEKIADRAGESVDLASIPRPMPAVQAQVHASPQNVIAIGASTGGTEALAYLLEKLPKSTPGVLIVQHMPPVFTKMFADRLDASCPMTVREARNGDRVRTGEVLIAPGDQHMRLREDSMGYYVSCSAGEKVSGHCPSVDVLFESVARCAKEYAVGVLLTGMGGDGAKQLLTMKNAGAHTIGQDRASCVVYGMPMVAQRIGALCEQLPLSSIPDAILKRFSVPQKVGC